MRSRRLEVGAGASVPSAALHIAEHHQRSRHVAAIATEALFAEPVGDAARSNRLQPFLDCIALAVYLAQRQHKTVPVQRTALQLAVVPGAIDHLHLRIIQRCDIRRDALGQMHAEALGGHGVAIFQASIADAHLGDARPVRELLGDVGGVLATIAHGEQQMLTFARRLERRQFVDLKVVRRAAHRRAEHGSAMCTWQQRGLAHGVIRLRAGGGAQCAESFGVVITSRCIGAGPGA